MAVPQTKVQFIILPAKLGNVALYATSCTYVCMYLCSAFTHNLIGNIQIFRPVPEIPSIPSYPIPSPFRLLAHPRNCNVPKFQIN